MSGGYVPEVGALSGQLAPLIPKMRLPYPRWIVTPDGDLGSEWCTDCGYYKVRNLRRHDRKRREDYILDGGWRTEEDGHKFCAGCGVRLDVCLTREGVEEEVGHFEEWGFTTNSGEDAYEISEMLSAVDWRSEQHGDREEELRQRVVAIAARFLAEQRAVAA